MLKLGAASTASFTVVSFPLTLAANDDISNNFPFSDLYKENGEHN
jgi:hypothetical protein